MTSYEFEKAAKIAVVRALYEKDIMVRMEDLQLVWFCHLVGNKKCLIYCPEMGCYYAEVTWHLDHQTMYVDLYQKVEHRSMGADQLEF